MRIMTWGMSAYVLRTMLARCVPHWARAATLSSLGESCYPGYCSNGGICENLDLGPTCTCKLGYEGM